MAEEYIEKKFFIEWVKETYCDPCEAEGRDYNHCRCGSCQYDDMMRDVECFADADVVPVVRCRDCKHSYKFRGDLRRCTRHTEGVPGRPIVVEDDDFCCWGRKTEEVQE